MRSHIKNLSYSQIISSLFVLLAFCIPISKAVTSISIVLLFLIWCIEGQWEKKYLIIKENKLMHVIFLLILLSFISTLWSPSFHYALSFNFRKYWYFLIFPVILTSFDIKYAKYVINGFLFGMLISEMVSYGIYFGLWSVNHKLPSDPSPFMDHTAYSTYLAVTLILIAVKFYYSSSNKWKIFYSLYFLTAMSNLFINGGRTGQVGFIVTVLVLAVVYFKSLKGIFLAFAFLIVTLIGAYNISPNFHNRVDQLRSGVSAAYHQKDYNGSLSRRYALWRIGTDVFLTHPLLGVGIKGDMQLRNVYCTRYGFPAGFFKGYLDYHNTFVQYAVQLGIVGLVTFMAIFYILATLKFQTKEYRIIAVAFTTIFVCHSFTGFSFALMNPVTLFCVFAPLLNTVSYRQCLSKPFLQTN